MKEWAGRCVGKALAERHLCASEAIAIPKREFPIGTGRANRGRFCFLSSGGPF
jgi:hypothetical protein